MKYFKHPLIILCLLLLSSASYAQNWAAFYLDSRTGITGGSYNSTSQKIAQNIAYDSCVNKHKKKGVASDCKYVGAFYNACGVVYWSPSTKRYTWAWDGIDAKRAGNRALRLCATEGLKDCQLSLSVCTTRYL